MMVNVRWGALVLIAAAGCGRFGFDPLGGAMTGDDTSMDAAGGDTSTAVCANAVGHDEDSDGVDDGCDVCPQIADNQSDTDGDLVGDACDLAPTVETRLFFDPGIVKRTGWRYDANQTFNGDSITLPGTAGASVVKLSGTPGRTVFEVGGRISTVGSGDRQIALHIGREASTNYYCELYDSGGTFDLKITYHDTGYNTLNSTSIPGQLSTGSTVRLVFSHTPPDLECVAWWNGVRYETTTTTASTVPLESMYLAANGIDAEIQYFVQLATP